MADLKRLFLTPADRVVVKYDEYLCRLSETELDTLLRFTHPQPLPLEIARNIAQRVCAETDLEARQLQLTTLVADLANGRWFGAYHAPGATVH